MRKARTARFIGGVLLLALAMTVGVGYTYVNYLEEDGLVTRLVTETWIPFFVLGAAFSYFIALPFMIQFLINYSASDYIQSAISVASYLDFMVGMLLTFGLVFELPMLAFVLSNLGILTPELLRRIRPYAIVLIFILAAVITPPDVVSQFMIAVPMIGLYELSIGISMVIVKHKKQHEDENEDDDEEDEDDE